MKELYEALYPGHAEMAMHNLPEKEMSYHAASILNTRKATINMLITELRITTSVLEEVICILKDNPTLIAQDRLAQIKQLAEWNNNIIKAKAL